MNESSDPNLCRITLMGPAERSQKANLVRLKLGKKAEWRKLVVELKIGSERWPDWSSANVCLTAMQDLIKMNEGFLTDEVVQAIQTHLDVVSYEIVNPPR
jgi:hypothetical protein